jgi:hypothetical protein
MGKEDLEERCDSSENRPLGSNSDGSDPNLKPNSESDRVGADTKSPETMLRLSDVLLSQLQSQLGELGEAGVGVKMFERSDGLAILLEEVRVCSTHQIIYKRESCPMC